MEYKDLYNWASAHNAKQQTEDGFIEMINNFIKESPYKITRNFGETFNHDYLRVSFYKIALTIRFDIDPNMNFIASYAKVEYDGEDKGIYKLIFNINGEIEDDYWLLNDD